MQMQSRVLLITIILANLIACVSNSPTPVPIALTPAPAHASLNALEFSAERAYEHNRMLAATIGARVAGTESGARAGDYLAQQFSNLGYTIEKQTFGFNSWEDRGTRVQITAPETRALQARPLQYSVPSQVEAELVAVGGWGEPSDFVKTNGQGKIALVKRGTLPFSDKARNAEQAGALAVIIFNDADGAYSGTLRDQPGIPALAISGRDGHALIEMLSQGAVKIKIESDTWAGTKTARNIIATKSGASDQVIVIGGHYDSVDAGAGAVDNASGTAVVLELARALANRPTKHTLVFIAFDAEELGLYGSRHYVASLADETRKKIVAMLNFDMLGGGAGPLLVGGDGRIGGLARDAAKELGIDARNFRLGNNSGSDHQPFQAIGIDTVFFLRNYDLLHTPQDALDQVHAEFLGEAGRVAARVLAQMEE